MKIIEKNYQLIVTEGAEKYVEKKQAQPTSRLLYGSSDCGYAAEYVGYGYIGDIPVKAIYLLTDTQINVDDEGDIDWDAALQQGRIVIDDNKITDDQLEKLEKHNI